MDGASFEQFSLFSPDVNKNKGMAETAPLNNYFVFRGELPDHKTRGMTVKGTIGQVASRFTAAIKQSAAAS